MVDTLLKHAKRALGLNVARSFGLEPRTYALLTLHRPGNVDDPDTLGRGAIRELSATFPSYFHATFERGSD